MIVQEASVILRALRRSSYSIIGSGFYANKTIMPITGA